MELEGRATSQDGTRIAYERSGDGATLILVGAALQDRATYRALAQELGSRLTVINYDRRGRGDSGDTAPYAVEREVEDLAALIDEVGGSASLYGHSSGAALVLHAASRGLPVDTIVLHEPPFGSGSEVERQAEHEEGQRIAELLDQGRRADAIRSFVTPMGLPQDVVDYMCSDPAILANAPTLRSDPFEVMSERSRGGNTPAEQASGVTVPALVLEGGASPAWMIDAGKQIAEALPNGRLHMLDGHDHFAPPDVLAPVLIEFVTNSRLESQR